MATEPETIQFIIDNRRASVRQRLVGANLSRLADRSGVSRWTLTRLRDGSHEPSVATLDAVEGALRADRGEPGNQG